MKDRIKAGIIGMLGYAGEELLRILSGHGRADVVYAADKAGAGAGDRKVGDIYPALEGGIKDVVCGDYSPEGLKKSGCDCVFLALPHGVSVNIVPQALDAGVKTVIDLSADYRINDIKTYEQWYQVKHGHKELLSKAVYGLPELYREKIGRAQVIANPGCYPTSIILACAPLFKGGAHADISGVIADSKSGYSGGGRKFAGEYEKKGGGNTYAYKTGGTHRHIPEVEQELGRLAGHGVKVTFTPHVMPQVRGMFSAVYPDGDWKDADPEELLREYGEYYSGEPFVRVLEPGKLPATGSVVKSNYCDIGISVDKRTDKLIVFSSIDNLTKGASGQAVQNMNIAFGIDEKEGL